MIVENLATKLVEYQIENPYRVLGALLLLTVMIVPGATQMEIKPSTEAVLPQEDPVVESLSTLRGKYYGDTTYMVFRTDDVRNNELLETMQKMENRIEVLENVHSVESPASMLERRFDRIPEDRETLENFNYRGTVSDNYKSATTSIRVDTQANPDEIRKLNSKLEQQIESQQPNAEVKLTGYNIIDLATFQVIISDFIRITGVAFLAVLGVLYGTFRDIRKIWFPISVVMFALIWMIGLGGWLGADLTIISMVSAAMIMGLGIDFGIHVTKKYYSLGSGIDSLSRTMVELSRGLLGASMTTAVGFLSLLFANLTGMHSLGIFLFTGIISAYIGAVFLLPTLLILIDGKESIK